MKLVANKVKKKEDFINLTTEMLEKLLHTKLSVLFKMPNMHRKMHVLELFCYFNFHYIMRYKCSLFCYSF